MIEDACSPCVSVREEMLGRLSNGILFWELGALLGKTCHRFCFRIEHFENR